MNVAGDLDVAAGDAGVDRRAPTARRRRARSRPACRRTAPRSCRRSRSFLKLTSVTYDDAVRSRTGSTRPTTFRPVSDRRAEHVAGVRVAGVGRRGPGRITVALATFAVGRREHVLARLARLRGRDVGAVVAVRRRRVRSRSARRSRGRRRLRRAGPRRSASSAIVRAARAAALDRRAMVVAPVAPASVVVAPRRRSWSSRPARSSWSTRARARVPHGNVCEHRPEPQLGGLADVLLRLLAVLHAGQVDDDRVALPLHVGFGDAEAVDAVADDVDRGVERARSVPLTGNSTIEMPPWRSRPSTGPVRRRQRRDERADDDRRPSSISMMICLRTFTTRTPWPSLLAQSLSGSAVSASESAVSRSPIAPRATRMTVPGAISRSAVVVAELDDPAEDPARRQDVVALLQVALERRGPATSGAAAGARAAGRTTPAMRTSQTMASANETVPLRWRATRRACGRVRRSTPAGRSSTGRSRRPSSGRTSKRPAPIVGDRVGEAAEPLAPVHAHLPAVRAARQLGPVLRLGGGRVARARRRSTTASRKPASAAPSGSYIRAPTVACWKCRSESRSRASSTAHRGSTMPSCVSISPMRNVAARADRGRRRRAAAARRPRPRARCTRRRPAPRNRTCG